MAETKFNLFSNILGTVNNPTSNFKPPMQTTGGGITAPIQPNNTILPGLKPQTNAIVSKPVQQPVQKPFTPTPVAKIGTQANASEKNLIQTYLDDDNEDVNNREQIFKMIQNGEDETLIEDAIVNKIGYTGIKPQEQGFIGGALEKTGESFMGGIKRIGEAGVGIAEGKYTPMEGLMRGGAGALQTAFSPISGVLGETLQTGIEKVPQGFKDYISTKTNPTIEDAKNWYNSQSPEQKRYLDNIGVGVEILGNFIGAKGVQKATPIVKQAGINTGKQVLKQGAKLNPTGKASGIAETVSTKANRFNALDEQKFINMTGETPGQFAVKRGMTEVGEKAVDKATNNYLKSVEQADNAFKDIQGNFKYSGKGNDPLKISLDDLEKRFINTESDNLPKIQALKTKYETEGLTMTEINEVKREYARNFKYGFEERNSEALARSSNIQNKLREWQFEKADEMGLTNIKEINKNTQAWKAYADSLEKKLNRSGANNAVSITDWISLSGGNVTNLALFLGKKIGTSDKAKQLLIKTFGKQTKTPIIKPNINKPQIKGLLGEGPIMGKAPETKSNIRVTPSKIQPILYGNKSLPAGGQSSYKEPAVITPQTKEKAVIQESKKGLNKTKFGNSNTNPAENYELANQIIDDTNNTDTLLGLKDDIKELGLAREKELLAKIDEKIKGINEINTLDRVSDTLRTQYGDDLINSFKNIYKNESNLKTTKGGDKYTKIEFNTTKGFNAFKKDAEEYLSQNPWESKTIQELYDELKNKVFDTEFLKESKIPLKKTKNDTNNNIPSNLNNSRVDEQLTPKVKQGKLLKKTESKPSQNLQKKSKSDNKIEVLPKEIDILDEGKIMGAKRIAPDRINHQQLTPEEGINKIKGNIDRLIKEGEIEANGYMARYSDISGNKKKYDDYLGYIQKIKDGKGTPAIEKYVNNNKDYFRRLKLKLDMQDILGKEYTGFKSAIEKLKNITDNDIKSSYIDLVKKDISKGYKYPEDVLNYDKSFKTAVDNRARYEKGLNTSFSSDDSRIVFDDRLGIGMKRQDGGVLEKGQIDEIVEGIKDFKEYTGVDIENILKKDKVVIAHLNGKHLFLMKKASGVYRTGSDGNKSVSVGGTESFKTKNADGEFITTKVNTTLSHELGHTIDYKTDNKLFNDFIGADTRKFNRGNLDYSQIRNYWGTDVEVKARLIAQYIDVKKGSTTTYNKVGNWDKDTFDKLMPKIEEGLNKYFGSK